MRGGSCTYRSLLSSTSNTRDLGGYPAMAGKTTLPNRIWRSDIPTSRCESDEKRLRALSLTAVLDLRTDRETARKPCAYAGINGFAYHRVPFTIGSEPPATLEDVPLSYLEIACQREAADALRIIAEADTGVLLGCTAGKDRTGVISALLLLACGVDRSVIVDDYTVSREYNRERLEAYLSEHPEVDRRIVLANPASMSRFLALFLDRFGSVESYFSQMNLAASHLAAIREKLLGGV